MIIRSKRTQNFTVIPNSVLEDKSLDWKALGLLVYLLSKPDDWSVSVPQLIKAKKAGEDAIRGMLKALRDAGYVQMQRSKSGEVDWLVYDTPHIGKNPNRENPDKATEDKATSGKSLTGKIPNRENPDVLIKTDKRLLKTESKKINKKDFDLPFWIDQEIWDEWMYVRKQKKAINSQRAMKSLVASLEQILNAGLDPNKAIETAITKSWKTVELEYLQNSGGQSHEASRETGKPGNNNAANRTHDRLRQRYAAAAGNDSNHAVSEAASEVRPQVVIPYRQR